jgi:hypothetical protein
VAAHFSAPRSPGGIVTSPIESLVQQLDGDDDASALGPIRRDHQRPGRHAQVILYSQFWQVDAGRTYGIFGTGLDWELDWTAPWEHLVEESRTWSLLEASEAPVGDTVFVAPTWIDRTDLYPER